MREGAELDEEQAGTPAYPPLDNALNRLETAIDILKDAPADAEGILRRTRQLRFDLNFIVRAADKQFVYWMERRGRGAFLRASPIDVSGLLQENCSKKCRQLCSHQPAFQRRQLSIQFVNGSDSMRAKR